MPTGLKRYYGSGDLHYITCSCYRRKPWLDTAARRNLFLKILEQVRREQRFVVLGYVVMPEHFRLLMSEPQVGNPSTVMQSLKQRFAQRVVPRRRRRNQAQAVFCCKRRRCNRFPCLYRTRRTLPTHWRNAPRRN